MNKQLIIDAVVQYVKNELSTAEGGHDWWHIYRVWKLAKKISEKEGGDRFTISLGALLHDIADAKFYNGNEDVGPDKAMQFLSHWQLKKETAEEVLKVIRFISFKNSDKMPGTTSLEFKIIQDADRLDAMGAIGIARAFNYGGYKNREIYNPGIKPQPSQSKQEYKGSKAPTINHFYEKLLLLKNLMNTATGKKLAKERHAFMEIYLKQFYNEWEGNL